MDADLFFMNRAIEQALLGFNEEEIPVGAVVVYKNKIISEAHNKSIQKTDPTSHAEIEAKKGCSQDRKLQINWCKNVRNS